MRGRVQLSIVIQQDPVSCLIQHHIMLRRKVQLMFFSYHTILSRLVPLLQVLLLLQFVVPLVQQAATNTEATATTPDKQQQSDRFALMVDTMFWIGNTEFGERDNWRKQIKPCTLLERININEQSVISLGDSMDALGGTLESNIKDLVLPLNGMLLLEDDTFSDPLDPLFIQYLNQSGDCFDGSRFDDDTTSNFLEHQFEFELDSDQMSWFNPDNWRSAQLALETHTYLIPESHMIPCNDDAVVFGSRRMAFKTTTEANERSKTLTFKVNFRPSLALIEELNFSITNKDLDVSQLRVSKFRIDTQSYNEQEFEQLVNSEQYENILFQFNDSLSLLKEKTGFAYPSHSLFKIDESSTKTELDIDFCLDEAGCICGNENTNVMKAICSFRNPIDPEQLPCHDPVLSSGYCNRICATVVTINMDPIKFKEAFIVHLMTELIGDDKNQLPDYFAESSRINSRRTSETKYEITLSLSLEGTDSDIDYEESSRIERKFVEILLSQLDNAKRSFYGIKSINFKSSSQWKTDNQKSIFMISFMIVLIGFIAIFIYEEAVKDEVGSDDLNNMAARQNDNMRFKASGNWFNGLWSLFSQTSPVSNDDETFVHYSEPIATVDSKEIEREDSMSEIPLVEFDSMTQ